MLSTINSRSELNKELIKSKLNLEKEFGIKINHFAFPFGTFKSINKNSLEILNQNFDFIHSGLRGNNKNIKNNKLVFRDAVNPEMGITRLKSFLIGNADFHILHNKLKIFNLTPKDFQLIKIFSNPKEIFGCLKRGNTILFVKVVMVNLNSMFVKV